MPTPACQPRVHSALPLLLMPPLVHAPVHKIPSRSLPLPDFRTSGSMPRT